MLSDLLFMGLGAFIWIVVRAIRELHRQAVIDLALQDMTNRDEDDQE